MSVPVPRQREARSDGARPSALPDTGLSLLVIEDDPAGAFSVPELLDTEGNRVRIRTARNLTEAARLLTDGVQCILLDLALPAMGSAAADPLDTLRSVLRLAPSQAVLVLTAEGDAERAAEAVRVGAQDFLFRGELDGRILSRAEVEQALAGGEFKVVSWAAAMALALLRQPA